MPIIRLCAVSLILGTFFGVPAHAATDPEAIRICESMIFESNRAPCFRAIHGGTYEPSVLELCREMVFDNGKYDCLQAARDKKFDADILASCKRLGTDTNKLNCLRAMIPPAPEQEANYICEAECVVWAGKNRAQYPMYETGATEIGTFKALEDNCLRKRPIGYNAFLAILDRACGFVSARPGTICRPYGIR